MQLLLQKVFPQNVKKRLTRLLNPVEKGYAKEFFLSHVGKKNPANIYAGFLFVTKLLVIGFYQEHTIFCFFNLAYPVHFFKRRRKRQF